MGSEWMLAQNSVDAQDTLSLINRKTLTASHKTRTEQHADRQWV